MHSEFKYGLICGTGVCLWIALEYALGFHTTRPDVGAYTGLLSNLVPLVTLFLLLRSKRAAIYDGRLSLGAGIGAGLVASFVASLLIYCCLAGYTHFINPTWIDQALEVKVAAWRSQLMPETDIQTRITDYRNAYTPKGLLWNIVVGTTLMGGLYSMILTVLVRQIPHRSG
jgi:hypothetical protein